MKTKKTKVTCYKCDGIGRIAQFAHVDNGRCFACAGAGELEYAETVSPKRGVFEFQVDGVLWQVLATVRDFEDMDDYGRPATSPGEANDFLIQAVEGAGRKGKTHFRIRLCYQADAREVATRIWKAAKAGTHPSEMTNDWLGFQPGRSQVTRDKRGVDYL